VDKNTTGIFLWKGVYIVLFYGKTKMIPFFKNQAESFDVVTEKIMTHENLAIATNGLLYESSDGTGGIQFYSRFSVSAAGVDDARPQGQVIFRDDGRIEGRKPKGDRACYLWEHNGVYRAGFYNPLEDMPAGSTLPSEGTVVTGMIRFFGNSRGEPQHIVLTLCKGLPSCKA
jgi:hypothetical protein